MQGEVGPETQGGPLALHRHHSGISFVSLVSWPGCQDALHQEEAKRSTKIGMLTDNGSDAYDPYWCYRDTHWPISAGSSDIGGGKFGSTSPLDFGVLVLPSTQSRT